MTKEFLNFLYNVKLIALVLILIFIIGIIVYSKKLKIIPKRVEKIKNWFGVNPLLESSSKSRRAWKEIQNLIEENYESSWKLAVLKTDSLIENFLKHLGFQGNNFHELLESLTLKGYRNLDVLHGTHQVCEEILNNKEYRISQKEALNIIAIYKKFWDELIKTII